MTADLVARLRALARHDHSDVSVADEAADELEAASALRSSGEASAWRPIAEGLPAGRYLVTDGESVGIARRRPKLGLWVFPSAQQAFKPTHYQPLPTPPTSTKA